MSRSQFHSIKLFILRHAWLNLWDKHMTTGRINQVTFLSKQETKAHAPPQFAQLEARLAAAKHAPPLLALHSLAETKAWMIDAKSFDVFQPLILSIFHWLSRTRAQQLQNTRLWQWALFWTSLDGERTHKARETAAPAVRPPEHVNFYVCPTGKHTNCNMSSSTTDNMPCSSAFEHRAHLLFTLPSKRSTSVVIVLSQSTLAPSIYFHERRQSNPREGARPAFSQPFLPADSKHSQTRVTV